MIGIVDYGVGNIRAFSNIYDQEGYKHKIVKSLSDLDDVDKIILPGVGAFDYAMSMLKRSGLCEKLSELVLQKRKPVLGVCVGMQIMADTSDEGNCSGLGWIAGEVKKIEKSSELPLPHMGWNSIRVKINSPLFNNIGIDNEFYFLHSYYFQCQNDSEVMATTEYANSFSSVVGIDNIYGIQCHPEKSHGDGIQILKNFGDL